VKSVICLAILDLKVVVAVTSVINIVNDLSAANVYMVKGKELKDPNKGTLVSPE
jgi:hypothetical protein